MLTTVTKCSDRILIEGTQTLGRYLFFLRELHYEITTELREFQLWLFTNYYRQTAIFYT